MVNDARIKPNFFGAIANTSSPRLGGVNADRQTRFDARAARRWGDWDGYLALATPLLWLETEAALCFDNECGLAPPAVIELWP